MNQAILKLIDDKIYGMYKVVTEDGPQDEYYSEGQQALLDLKNEISSLPSDTQWIDAIKRVQSLIDIELYDHDGASINESYLRGLEDALGEIKGEPPERNLIS